MKSKIIQINTEPFIKLKFENPTKTKHLIYNQTLRQKAKYSFFQSAYDFIYNNKVSGDYFEFGVHKARTFRFALRESIIKQMQMKFYAFDSFKGLPNDTTNLDENPFYKPGGLVTSKKNFLDMCYKFSKKRKIEIIEGYYEKSLNDKLINKFKKKKVKTAFINIDCDLIKSFEKSLKFSLNFITDGSILYIDDYYNSYKGNPKKGINYLTEKYLKKNKINFQRWHIVGSFGQSFILYK